MFLYLRNRDGEWGLKVCIFLFVAIFCSNFLCEAGLCVLFTPWPLLPLLAPSLLTSGGDKHTNTDIVLFL